MPRWLLWTPLAALTAAAAVFGLRLGLSAVSLSETDIINEYANRYVAGASGRVKSACFAVPGRQSNVWIVVICGEKTCEGDAALDYTEYHISRAGRFIHAGAPYCDLGVTGHET